MPEFFGEQKLQKASICKQFHFERVKVLVTIVTYMHFIKCNKILNPKSQNQMGNNEVRHVSPQQFVRIGRFQHRVSSDESVFSTETLFH